MHQQACPSSFEHDGPPRCGHGLPGINACVAANAVFAAEERTSPALPSKLPIHVQPAGKQGGRERTHQCGVGDTIRGYQVTWVADHCWWKVCVHNEITVTGALRDSTHLEGFEGTLASAQDA